MGGMKVCSQCSAEKPLEEFAVDQHPKRAGVGGRKSACKSCDATRAAAYRAEHLEQERARQREYQRRRRASARGRT